MIARGMTDQQCGLMYDRRGYYKHYYTNTQAVADDETLHSVLTEPEMCGCRTEQNGVQSQIRGMCIKMRHGVFSCNNPKSQQ